MTFLFVGNDPALDFVNTELADADLLQSLADLVAWLTAAGLLDGPGRRLARRWEVRAAGTRAFTEARAFRDLMRRSLAQAASGRGIPDALIQEVNRLLRRGQSSDVIARRGARLVRDTRRRVSAPGDLVVLLADAIARFLCNADLSRVRKCANRECVLYFYDTSKNQTRRWCRMDVCGNRAKVAAWTRRHLL